MKIGIKFLALTFATIIASCGAQTGGNEVPNMIRGNVTHNSTVLPNSMITIKEVDINATGASLAKTYSTTTDSKGDFEVEVDEEGLYTVVVEDAETNSKAISSEVVISGDKAVDLDITMATEISLTGRISRNKIVDTKVLYVFIPGTDYIADSIDENGFYRFKNLPQGDYPIAYTYGNKGTIIKVKTEAITKDSLFIKDIPFVDEIDTLQTVCEDYLNDLHLLYYVKSIDYGNYTPQWYTQVDFSGVKIYDIANEVFVEQENIASDSTPVSDIIILDDFENVYGDSPNQNTLAAKMGSILYPTEIYKAGGTWYAYSDVKNDNGNSEIQPNPLSNTGSDISPLIINNDESLNNSSLSVGFTLRNQCEYPFAGIGFLIYGDTANFQDLSSMEKLSFWAKGEGSFRVKFFSSHDDENLNDKGHFGKNITLTSEWVLYEIKPSDITAQSGSDTETQGLSWSDAHTKINKIHFETLQGQEVNIPLQLMLDDIAIHGVSLEDITK